MEWSQRWKTRMGFPSSWKGLCTQWMEAKEGVSQVSEQPFKMEQITRDPKDPWLLFSWQHFLSIHRLKGV